MAWFQLIYLLCSDDYDFDPSKTYIQFIWTGSLSVKLKHTEYKEWILQFQWGYKLKWESFLVSENALSKNNGTTGSQYVNIHKKQFYLSLLLFIV